MSPILCGLSIMGEVLLTRRVSISAMHELKSDKLSEAENRRIFGKCFNTHGHDYHLEVTIQGSPDLVSGLICDRDFFEDKLQSEFVDKFNKTHLNHFFPNTSGECLAEAFYNLLLEKLRPLALVKVRLQETPKNLFSFPKP